MKRVLKIGDCVIIPFSRQHRNDEFRVVQIDGSVTELKNVINGEIMNGFLSYTVWAKHRKLWVDLYELESGETGFI